VFIVLPSPLTNSQRSSDLDLPDVFMIQVKPQTTGFHLYYQPIVRCRIWIPDFTLCRL